MPDNKIQDNNYRISITKKLKDTYIYFSLYFHHHSHILNAKSLEDLLLENRNYGVAIFYTKTQVKNKMLFNKTV